MRWKSLASILSELRWLAVLQPKTLAFTWRAGAYSGQDGLGGHVHFGRKRKKLLDIEVAALDRINLLLHAAGIYSIDEAGYRLQKKYGNPGDWRPQVHGYEYRSLPSWLQSPWIAYLSIVLCKLAVLNPQLILAGVVDKAQPRMARERIRNILAYFKSLDDDALLAFLGMDVWGLPAYNAYDVKGAWGISVPTLGADKKNPTILPLSVAPSVKDIEDIYFYILQGRQIYSAQPSEAQWPFQHCPKGFEAFQKVLDTHLCPGLGELCWDVVRPKGLEFEVTFIGEGNDPSAKEAAIHVSKGLTQYIPYATLKKFPFVKAQRDGWEGLRLAFNKKALDPKHLPITKAWFLSGLFPVARYCDAEKLKFEYWNQPPKQQNSKSVLLYAI